MRKSVIASVGGLVLCLTGCATTKYAGTPVAELSDEQLATELVSAGNELGVQLNQASMLAAMTPDPQYVMASSTTFTSGQMSADYTAYTMPRGGGYQTQGNVAGTYSGTSTTNYNYYDANATQRSMYQLAAAVAQSRARANRERAEEVIEEMERRRDERNAAAQKTITAFFDEHPEMRSRRVLVGAIYPWVAAANPEMSAREQLEQTHNVAQSLNQGPALDGRWFGVIEQVTTRPSGERVSLQEFLFMELAETDDGLVGRGLLASGEEIELYGQLDGIRLRAIAANRTSGINVEMEGSMTPGQITGTYRGSGPSGNLAGNFALYR